MPPAKTSQWFVKRWPEDRPDESWGSGYGAPAKDRWPYITIEDLVANLHEKPEVDLVIILGDDVFYSYTTVVGRYYGIARRHHGP